jgi:erythromycin esterase
MTDGNAVDRLERYVTALPDTDPTTAREHLAPLAGALSDARLVGLGEATHGTHEFVTLRDGLVRSLVADHGFRLLALEVGFAESLALDRHVAGGDGHLDALLRDLGLWVWATEELRGLLEWVRAFNEGRPAEDRVRVLGFDAPSVSAPAGALSEYLRRVAPETLATVRDGLDDLADGEARGERFPLAADHVGTGRETVATLEARFDAHEDEWVRGGDAADYRLARGHLRALAAAIRFSAESYRVDVPHGAVDVRDEAMAGTVAWLVEWTDVDHAVCWAHNGHLFRGLTDGTWEAYTPMGRHLHERFGEDYRVVATAFDRGAFRAFEDPEAVERPEPRTFEVGPFADVLRSVDESFPTPTVGSALLEATGEADAVRFDVARAAADPTLGAWLEEPHPLRDVPAAFRDEADHRWSQSLAAETDALLFVPETTPTTLLKDAPRHPERS